MDSEDSGADEIFELPDENPETPDCCATKLRTVARLKKPMRRLERWQAADSRLITENFEKIDRLTWQRDWYHVIAQDALAVAASLAQNEADEKNKKFWVLVTESVGFVVVGIVAFMLGRRLSK